MRIKHNYVECGKEMFLTPNYYYKKGIRRCSQACATLGKRKRPLTEEWKRKIGLAQKGKPRPPISDATKQKMNASHKGKSPWSYWSKEKQRIIRLKISKTQAGRDYSHITGSKSHFWRGGRSSENHKLRNSQQYAIWRRAVFERDHFTCQICGIVVGRLQADHIKPFAYYPSLRFDISNGRTLCVSCHKKTDTYLNRHWKPNDLAA